MLLNKTKTFVFLFTIFISSFTFSQSTTSQFLDLSACDAYNNTSSYSITYTDDGDTFFGNGDTISSSDTDPAFDYTSEYYYSFGDVYKVTFSSDGTGGYNITVSSSPEDTTSCGAGAGASQFLDLSACDAYNNTSSYSITYTDDGDTFFGNGDTISSSDTDPAFDYTSEYYYSFGDVYKVTFSSDGTGGYNITVSSSPEDTTSCGAGAGASQFLDLSACDAYNNTSSYSITYTDDGDTFFGNGDTISSSDTDPAFDYTSEYYYSFGDVYKVTFSSDGTGGYNITVSSSPEDTTSCGAGAGASQFLDLSACDAYNNTSSYSITYTDDGDTFFGNGDTISSSDTDPAFDYTSEYYYSFGDVYKVTFSSDGTGGYNITVSSSPEDTTSCGAGAGASQFLDLSACDAYNNTSSYSITYTDDGDTFFGNGDTISSSDTDPAFDYTSEYYYSFGDVYKVTFSSDGTGGYNITVSSSPEDTTSCGAGAGASQFLDLSACDAYNNTSSYSITYTDDGDTFFGNGDTISSSDTDPAFDYTSEYYYSFGDVYKVTFSSDGTGGYNITVSSSPEDTTSCGAGAGASQFLDLSACDAYNNTSSYSITYTDDGDTFFGNGDTISSSDTDPAFDYTSEYYYSFGDVYKVTFSSDGTGGYNITVSSSPEDTTSCGAGAGASQFLDLSACDAYNNTSSYSITYTDDGDTFFGNGDTISSSDTDPAFDYTSEYYYSFGDVYKVTFSSDGTGGYNITVSSSPEDTTSCGAGAGAGAGGDYTPYFIYDNSENACSQEVNTLTLYVLNENSLDLNDAIDSQNSFDISDFSATYYYNDGSNTYSISFDSPVPGNYIINTKNLINCAPSFTSDASFTAAENQLVIGDATATDPDADATLVYSISGTELEIVASTGAITFAANPDFETKNSYTATVTVTDGTNPVEQEITVTVSDVDEISPEFDETPSTSEVAQTKFTLNADINEEGIIYYVVVADGALAPSSSEVRAGTGNGGTGELASGNATVDSGDYIYDFIVSGLTGGTAYDVYLVAEDNEAIPNLQAIPEKLDVTTAELISLTITGITGGDKVYDDTTAASASGTATLVGVEAGDDVFLGGSPVFTFASANVGTGITMVTSGYAVSGTDAGNYTLTQPTLSGDITAKELTITGITGGDKVYDDTTAASASGTATLVGVEAGDDVFLGGSPVFTFASANVGTGITITTSGYTISGTDSENYTLTQPTLSGDITAKELTITGITGGDKVYDDTTAASASGTATLVGVEAGDDVFLGGSPVFTFASANVGTGITMVTSGYAVSGTDAGNYTLTQPTLSGDITAKELTITGITGGDKVYDDTTAASASGTATLVGVEAGDDVFLGGSPVFTFASANVGTGITITTSGYTISGTDSENYTLTQPTLSGDITAKELTITGITGGDKVYDDTTAASASGTATLVGVEAGDDVFLGGSPVFTFASANVGTGITITTSGYTISGTDSGNYTLTQPTLSGDITAAPLTVTASDQTKVYGATDPVLTYSITGFVNGDLESDLDTAVSISRAVGETVGTYTITPSAAADSNYAISFVTADFSITAAPLTVTASDQTKVYGATDPVLTYSITGFVNGDLESDLDTAVSISRAVGETVGTYTITPSAAADSNYAISFVTADFSITAAPLTVTASDQTKVYGATDPVLTYSITGFVNGDLESDLDTGVSISRAVGETVGTYAITPSAAADSNYAISFVTADFSITAAPLTVTASDQTKVYGATDPVLTYSITGFVNGDLESDLDTAVSISRAVGETVGTYTITPSAATDSNYAISFVTADFSITAAPLTVTASDQTKVYGATDPVLTYSITGFVNGDLESDLDTAVSISRAVGEACRDIYHYTISSSR